MSEGIKKRQNTLLASLLLSLWAPLATGLAVIVSRSVTQVSDFIRRTMELLVLLLSWLVFRYLAGREDITPQEKQKWERIVNLSVAAALAVSGAIMFVLAILYHQNSRPGGNVVPGLIIAILGFIVNLWFYRRYKALGKEEPSTIMDAQRQLYLAKVLVDTCVIAALGTVFLWPDHPITRYVDAAGSVGGAFYLLWSSVRMLRQNGANALSKQE